MKQNPTFVTFDEQLEEELEIANDCAHVDSIEPTEEEKRNGWTAEALTEYLTERQAGASLAIDPHSLHRKAARRPGESNHHYSPKRWRG